MKVRHIALALALLPALGGWDSCGSSLTNDPSFDLWCGQQLCDWHTDSGAALRVPTWHEDDWGVELSGNPAGISQLLVEKDDSQPTCLRFETNSNIDDGASVTVGLDFGDDGTIDEQVPVPSSHWESVSFLMATRAWYPSVRFLLRKTGDGRAVLAHMLVAGEGSTLDSRINTSCPDPPAPFNERPPGAPCQTGSNCKSGVCGASDAGYGRCQ